MESNRRSFLKHTASLMGMTILSPSLNGLANVSRNIHDLIDTSHLTIYQSNDLNLSFHPSIYNKIRSELNQQISKGLTVDAGNLFDLDKINLEMLQSINSIGYHAVALSSNYLKTDIQSFLKLAKSFNFPLINCNYSSNETGWSESIKQYVIFNTKNLKIGITSVAQNSMNSKIIVENPYKAANRIAKKLKSENKCDLVICLSQLGMDKTKTNSRDLAIASKNIDFVLSTTEGQKLNYPLILRNKNDQEVILMQGGSGGELICKSVIGYDNDKYRNLFHQEFIMPTKSFASKTDIHKTVKNLQNV
ncbi:hypothetical protein [Empedobacter sp. UBA7248]|uniref:hypothetical protein n=1 Tax=Empedobacter sp. UBA7248 TaxID=1946448 RepID=UPI0025BB3835|nr:hypothetical protein [Empedobacter sp. UBA7248]